MILHHETHGRGERLVLVHGFTQTGRSWSSVAAQLTDRYEVVLVDAPGHGGSSDIAVGLQEGAALLGATGGRATYVGYSMGGRLALHLALAQPDVVERLVLLGATAGIEDPAEREARRRADDELAASIERDGVPVFLERWLQNPLFARLPEDAAALADRRRNTPAGLASSLRLAGTGTQESLWGRLASLAMPVLVLAGEHDAKFRILGERIASAIGTNARFEVVPDAGHAAHLERPGAFAQQVEMFLARP
ncbi:MAG: alpha/beta fold hydrolase [Acidimicrobiia bacterium]